MLRLLVLLVLLAVATAAADTSDFKKAVEQADHARNETRAALEDADAVDVTETLPSFDEAVQHAQAVPGGMFPNLGAELTDPQTLTTIGDLMDDAQGLAANLGVVQQHKDGALSIYVFASFSMPNASLRDLITQGELAGVPIVLRGLVNNSVEDTMHAVHALYDKSEQQESGAVIDPTLFERFGVDQVPTVVVARYAAAACTPDACPTPEHVKIAGDVPLRYSLDRITLARPAFRHELRQVMKKLEPERKW